ncbi:MAG: hypothetical protein Kow0063_05510 [Anaerolineae bacterium]
MEDRERTEKGLKELAVAFRVPPKIVYNDRGEKVEVILNYDDYLAYLRYLADYVDWETLPPFLQDAVDGMLADEALAEQGDEAFTPLDQFLTELGVESESGQDSEEG